MLAVWEGGVWTVVQTTGAGTKKTRPAKYSSPGSVRRKAEKDHYGDDPAPASRSCAVPTPSPPPASTPPAHRQGVVDVSDFSETLPQT